jgi:HupE / UreJ protein
MLFDFIELGFDHILDPNGIDHILFVATLCSLHFLDEWRKVLILVTAFTVGHSLTLALASLRLVNVSVDLVETIIPITIILTAIYNVFIVLRKNGKPISSKWHYVITLLFGLIHGLGFSNYFKAMFGEEENILTQLFGFNVGVELGQLIIVSVVSIMGHFLVKNIKLSPSIWTIGISSTALLYSIRLLIGI